MKIKVTPVSRKFGKYMPGDAFELPARAARLYIKIGKLAEVTDADIEKASMNYQTRAMTAAPAAVVEHTAAVEVDAEGVEWNAEIHAANKLKKADGTWRKRAGRSAQAEA